MPWRCRRDLRARHGASTDSDALPKYPSESIRVRGPGLRGNRRRREIPGPRGPAPSGCRRAAAARAGPGPCCPGCLWGEADGRLGPGPRAWLGRGAGASRRRAGRDPAWPLGPQRAAGSGCCPCALLGRSRGRGAQHRGPRGRLACSTGALVWPFRFGCRGPILCPGRGACLALGLSRRGGLSRGAAGARAPSRPTMHQSCRLRSKPDSHRRPRARPSRHATSAVT